MNREIKWLGEAPQVGVGASQESLIQGNFAAYKNGKLIAQWYKSWNFSGEIGNSPWVEGNADDYFLKNQWPTALAKGADRLCVYLTVTTNYLPGAGMPLQGDQSKVSWTYNGCYDGKTFSQSVSTNTPVTVNCGPLHVWNAALNKCVPVAPRQSAPPQRQMSPYAQTFQSIYGSPEEELTNTLGESDDGTLGQTRYQEYDPRTGAAIGSPLTEAEYRARSDLRPFMRVRLVFVPNIPNYAAAYCTQLYGKANYAYQTYEELVKTYAILQKEGIQPYAAQAMQTAIQNAYASFSSLWELGRQLGCTWWKPLRA